MTVARTAATSGERRALTNWIICWVLIPLLPFIILWIVGGPPRYPEILLIGGIGLAVRRSRRAVRTAALIALMGYAALTLISSLFNLSVFSMVSAAQYLLEIQPSASLEYVLIAVLLMGCAVAAVWFLRLDSHFESQRMVMTAFLAVFLVAGVDYSLASSTRGSYKRSAPGNATFSSAIQQTGIGTQLDQRRNVLIVMVESMGLPTDERLRHQFMKTWFRPALANRFTISTGSSPYFGSTTNGEMRELCGRWANYEDVEDFASSCLPARLARQGYQTSALHSFDGAMFDRAQWYPRIGFQKMSFGPDLITRGTGTCSGVFPGACDRDVPPLIAQTLTNRDNGHPQFIYWLTVNSHLPVPAASDLHTRSCEAMNLTGEKPMVCRMFSIWSDISDSLTAVLTRHDLPPTDVLIVGDHMPPFFDRSSRLKFNAERVPWVLLKFRGTQTQPTAALSPTHR